MADCMTDWMTDCMTDLMVDWMADWMAGLLFYFLSVWGLALESFKLFQKKMVLALEFLSLPFQFLTNASANLLVLVAKLSVTPQLGLQRHLASKVAPKAPQGVPKGSQKVSRQPQRLHKASQKEP